MEIAQTVDNALRMLELIGDEGPLTLAELAVRLELSRTSTYRLIVTLLARDFLERAGSSQFGIGSRVGEIAELSSKDGAERLQIWLNWLSNATSETVVFGSREGKEFIVQRKASSDVHLLKAAFSVGYRFPITVGATGKAILAAERCVNSHGSISDALDDLSGTVIRTHNEVRSGLYGLAAPVVIEGNIAAIGVIVPEQRAAALPDIEPKLLRVQGAFLSRANKQSLDEIALSDTIVL